MRTTVCERVRGLSAATTRIRGSFAGTLYATALQQTIASTMSSSPDTSPAGAPVRTIRGGYQFAAARLESLSKSILLGGNRLVHNSVTYGYHCSEGVTGDFYDAGSLWNHGQTAIAAALDRRRISAEYIFGLRVAFPVREGRMDPVFMVGMNY